MAGTIDIKPATKLRLALDVPAGKQPVFNMISTFNKALDESAFFGIDSTGRRKGIHTGRESENIISVWSRRRDTDSGRICG